MRPDRTSYGGVARAGGGAAASGDRFVVAAVVEE